MKRVLRSFAAVAVVSFLAVSSASAAITPFVDQSGGTPRNDVYPQAGWGFAADTSGTVQINALGYLDEGDDGLAVAHDVGLYHWNGSTGDLIAKATIPAGTGGFLEGGYRWVNIPTVTLTDTSGQFFYFVLASQGPETWYDGGIVTVTPAFGTVYPASGFHSGVAMPNVGETAPIAPGGVSFSGPNIGFGIIIPEPTSIALALAGLALFGLLRRRRG